MEKEKDKEKTWLSGYNRKSWCDRDKPCKFCYDYINVTLKFGGGMKQSCRDRPPHLKTLRPGGMRPRDKKKKPKHKSKNRSVKGEEDFMGESDSSGEFVNPDGRGLVRQFMIILMFSQMQFNGLEKENSEKEATHFTRCELQLHVNFL